MWLSRWGVAIDQAFGLLSFYRLEFLPQLQGLLTVSLESMKINARPACVPTGFVGKHRRWFNVCHEPAEAAGYFFQVFAESLLDFDDVGLQVLFGLMLLQEKASPEIVSFAVGHDGILHRWRNKTRNY